MANFIGLLAARAAKADWDVREEGVNGGSGRRLRIYASTETHTWIQKAADLAGLGTSSIRWIPTDTSLRTEVGMLRRQIDIQGRYMLRACIVNFHTDIPDIEALPEIVVRLEKTLDRLLRPPMLGGQNSADSSQAG